MAKNVKTFIKEFALNKSLDTCIEDLDKGDGLSMFNNDYRVLSPKGSKQILLKDKKDITFAMPASRIKSLLKKRVIQKMYKSNGRVLIDTLLKADKNEKPLPLYHNHNGKVKVSMDPEKWIHSETGHAYTGPFDEEAHHELQHEEDSATSLKFHKTIAMKAHPDDHENLKKLANKYLSSNRMHKNLKETHKAHKNGVAKEYLEHSSKFHEEAVKCWKGFTESYKKSVKKKITGDK